MAGHGRGCYLDIEVRKKSLSEKMTFWQRPERNEDLGGKCPCERGKKNEGPNKLVVFEEHQRG